MKNFQKNICNLYSISGVLIHTKSVEFQINAYENYSDGNGGSRESESVLDGRFACGSDHFSRCGRFGNPEFVDDPGSRRFWKVAPGGGLETGRQSLSACTSGYFMKPAFFLGDNAGG